MKTVRHGPGARDNLLHIEADGCIINVRVGLSDVQGARVTSIQVGPDDDTRGGDGAGYFWHVADAGTFGLRLVRLPEGQRFAVRRGVTTTEGMCLVEYVTGERAVMSEEAGRKLWHVEDAWKEPEA